MLLLHRIFVSAVLFCSGFAHAQQSATVPWLRSDSEAFAQARNQHRFVILYLEAVWCHWCHVMDEKTYGDAGVRAELRAHYVPLRIDQDLRPDLANRYREYGWPATVIFAADGTEIAKRQGYVEAEPFRRLLKAVVADPSPEQLEAAAPKSAAHASALDTDTRAELIKRHRETYDAKLGGLDIGQKYLDRDSVEYAIVQAMNGDASEAEMAKHTLDAANALFDPVWGGVYQYSTHSDWQHPHYEKLATVQGQYLRIYALACAAFGRPADREAVHSIRRYLDAFLRSPDSAYYASQDADLKPGEHATDYFALNDARRRARGVPRVDKHVYALQNGQIIEGLATAAELTGDVDALDAAKRAADWIVAQRALDGGGFRHDELDTAGPYLGDTLAMGRAFLALYRATADRAWLARAGAAADFIAANFLRGDGSLISAKTSGPIAAQAQIDENISAARFANLLAHYDGKATHRDLAEAVLRWLAEPNRALTSITEPGILLVDDEVHGDPLHLTVLAAKSDASGKVLFSTMQRLPAWYKRIDWWDKIEGPLPNPDVSYPAPKRAAAFVCTSSRCSLPMFSPTEIAEFLKSSVAKK
jgi:uncharacterized protein YyaL (SSP411 family)